MAMLWSALGVAVEPATVFIKSVGDHMLLLGQSLFWMVRRMGRAPYSG